MTTITVNRGLNKNPKTKFDTAQELFIYLREKLFPIKLYQVDEESLSNSSIEKIEESRNNPNRKLADFKG